MAKLAAGGGTAGSAGAIPVQVQLLAVAWMRWRMFANGFRRQPKTGRQVVGLALVIVLRMIAWPVMALMVIGPVAACGFFGWLAIAHHRPQDLAPMLAGVFLFWQFISINGVSMAATVSSFDPSSLVRFPLPFGRYLVLRMLLGLMTPSTVIGCLSLLAAAVGIGVADHSLALAALVALGVYALMNVLFTRMLGAWIERWLATRRAREVFGVLTAMFVIGIQFLNVRNMGTRHHGVRSSSWILTVVEASRRFLGWLPPGFAANAILLKGHPLAALGQLAALLAWTALFLWVFAIRLHKQFLGEYLSDGAARSMPAAGPRVERAVPRVVATRQQAEMVRVEGPERGAISPVIRACLRKEWLYLRGNGGQLIAMLTPLFLVFLLSRGLFASHPNYLLPGAIGYVLLGFLSGMYNIFGADGSGVQLYLLAPVRLRDVILAKNIASLMLVGTEVALAWVVVMLVSTAPIALATQVSAALWTVFVVGTNLALGTLRSVQAPRKFVPGQMRRARTPTNRTSALLVMAVFFGCLALQVPVLWLSRHFGEPWLGAMVFAPLAAAAVAAYAVLLHYADRIIVSHKDVFAEELCRA